MALSYNIFTIFHVEPISTFQKKKYNRIRNMIRGMKLDKITKPQNAAAVLVIFLKNQNKTHSGIQITQSFFQFLHNFIIKTIFF